MGGGVPSVCLATTCDTTRPPLAGPDLQVVLAPGYRMSWASIAGQAGDVPLAPATGHWRADATSASGPAVAGVLLSTRAPSRDTVRLVDLAATVLAYFGLPALAGADGRPMF